MPKFYFLFFKVFNVIIPYLFFPNSTYPAPVHTLPHVPFIYTNTVSVIIAKFYASYKAYATITLNA